MLQWHPRLIGLFTALTLTALALGFGYSRGPGWKW